MTGMTKLKTSDGATIGAYVATPAGSAKGGMVVLQEIFGVNHHIRAVTDFYAAQGYLAIAPALFDRVKPDVELGYDGDQGKTGAEIRSKTKIDDTLADIAAALDHVKGAGKVGVVGYCWGGTLAYAAPARMKGFSAGVGYYGGMIAQMLDLKPAAPVILHFGELDKHIPMSDVEKIRAAKPEIPVYTYRADHGFNCDERASYDAAAAELARRRSIEFFGRHLG